MFCVSFDYIIVCIIMVFIVAFNAEKLDQPVTEDKKKRIVRQINFTWLLVLILVILAFTSTFAFFQWQIVEMRNSISCLKKQV